MNVTDYTHLINKPDLIQEKQTEALAKVLDEFPYFQSARAIRLKGLYNQNSFRYNTALKTTAAYTTDRSILFDFITSDTFTALDKNLYERKALEILDIYVHDSQILVPEEKPVIKINKLEQSILTSIKEASSADSKEIENSKIEETPKTVEEKLEIGQPLDFSKKEQHSFQEWLQLSRTQPIKREIESHNNQSAPIVDPDKQKK